MRQREKVTNAFIYIFPQGHPDSCTFSERRGERKKKKKKALMRSLGV